MSEYDWQRWLREWNRTLSGGRDDAEWLGAPGATEPQLAALETRLGVTLPPSYRSFLQTSNGFRQPGVLVPRLLPAEEVDWYRAAHQETIDAWTLGRGQELADARDDSGAFERHLPATLQVSAVEEAGTAVYLLNPNVVDASGEWEAFYFAHWIPGVTRHRSFRALMQEERSTWTPPENSPTPPALGPAQRTTLRRALRRLFGGS